MKFRLVEEIDINNLYKNIPKYLYHATYGKYLDLIKKDGVIKGGVNKTYSFSNPVICLSPDLDEAGCFADAADNIADDVYDSGVYVLKICTDNLDKSKLTKDRNTTPWEENGIWYGITYEYSDNIPISEIKEIIKY